MTIINQSSCETSPIFGQNGPPVIGASVVIGGVQLVPSPFVSFNIEKYKMGDFTIGGVLRVTLNGTVVGDSFNDVVKGVNGKTGLHTIQNLAGLSDCVSVLIECSDQLFDGCGRILSVSANEGNQPTWVNIAPYTIELELYLNEPLDSVRIVKPDSLVTSSATVTPVPDDTLMLKNISENFSYSINDDTFNWGKTCYNVSGVDGFGNRHIKLNFSISAVGLRGCPSGCSGSYYSTYKYGLEAAEKYISDRLTDLNIKNLSILNDAPNDELVAATDEYTGGSKFCDFRTININAVENSIEVNGEIIYRPSGCKPDDVFTTLNVEQQLNTDGETIIISGNITGLVNNTYSDIIQLDDGWTTCTPAPPADKIAKAESFLKLITDDTNTLKEIANCYKSEYGYLKDTCPYSAAYDDCATTSTPTPTPGPIDYICDLRLISQSITRNISSGEINFSFTLSNTPNCDIIGAKKVNIEVVHDKPHDNIVEILIPGRGSKGVIVQNLCCNSAEKVDIIVDATLNAKICNGLLKRATIDELRACADKTLNQAIGETDIDYNCWFKTNDQETIGNTTYKLSKTYVKPSCP